MLRSQIVLVGLRDRDADFCRLHDRTEVHVRFGNQRLLGIP